uniref:Uncharacterized protein n=1 Tax=Anopheles culicifacies TaxID=139723 RepID=A0A182LYN4_9DIPT
MHVESVWDDFQLTARLGAEKPRFSHPLQEEIDFPAMLAFAYRRCTLSMQCLVALLTIARPKTLGMLHGGLLSPFSVLSYCALALVRQPCEAHTQPNGSRSK